MGLKESVDENVQEETLVKEPKKYKVLLLNDDFTSMDFVVGVLVSIFGHSIENAIDIMLKIHKLGRGLCGVYTYEIAETKVFQVERMARAENFPLQAVIEEE